MKKFTTLFKWKRFHWIIPISAVFTVMLLFQGQDVNYSEDNPNIDRMPHDLLSRNSIVKPPPVQDLVTVYTSSEGYDNFQIGTDNQEPHMSVNTQNPFNFLDVFTFVTARYTLDGFDWTVTNTGIPASISDPWTTCDSLGNFYFINLNTASGASITKSTNGGVTWGPITTITGPDKETIVADQTGGPYANYVYTTITGTGLTQCYFTRSTDFGASFTQTTTLNPHTLPGAMVAIGPNGNIQGGSVYVATYSGSNAAGTYTFHRSTDGGLTFTAMSSQSGISYVGTEISGRSTINGARTRPYPWIAADNSYGTYRGRLYVVWENNDPPGNGNKSDIFLKYSTDQGATWSASVLVNDNPSPQTTNQWFPAIWCEKETGILYIKWYDMRNDPNNLQVEVYGTYTTNGGVSFAPNQKISTQAWSYPTGGCAAPCYKGDYDMIAASKFGSLSTWYDGRFGSNGSFVGYLPDFAMKVRPDTLNITNQNDSGLSFISIPSVKLYSNKVRFTATVTPAPGAGTLTLSFLNRAANTLQDTLTSYPDSLRISARASGGVTTGAYTVTITARGRIGGQNGPPVHKRTIALNVGPIGIISQNEIPDKFYLYQNYPNPFNPMTNIRFDLAKSGHVRLTVYDITGKVVEVIADKDFNKGSYNADFNADNLSSGIYFYRLETNEFTAIRKMILIK